MKFNLARAVSALVFMVPDENRMCVRHPTTPAVSVIYLTNGALFFVCRQCRVKLENSFEDMFDTMLRDRDSITRLLNQ